MRILILSACLLLLLAGCGADGIFTRQELKLPYTKPQQKGDGTWDMVEATIAAGKYYNSINHDVGVEEEIEIKPTATSGEYAVTFKLRWWSKRETGGFWGGLYTNTMEFFGKVADKLHL